MKMKICILLSVMATSVLGCKDDVLFVVDESELMRNTKWTVGNRNGFQRVNDQIVDYLQAVSVSPSPGVAKAGYISLGMDDDDRSAARQVVALNSNLNLVSNAINGVTAQNIGIFWNQVAVSLPKLITAASKVVIITATAPSDIETAAVSSMVSKLGAEVFVIGVPFKIRLTESALRPLATKPGNVKALTDFDNFSIRNQLEKIIPVTCYIQDTDCSRCDFDNGVPFINDENDCHKFYLCEFKQDAEQPIKHPFMCPFHTVWDQEKITCVHEDDSNRCSYCMPPNEFGNYSTTDNCRQYRECNGTQVYTDKCCPLGQKFDKARLTCVNDVTCLDKCGDDGRSFSCNKYPVDNNICKFEVREPGHPYITAACAEGTKFSRKHCLCVWILPGETCTNGTEPRDLNGCLWTVELPFSAGLNGLQTRGQDGINKGPSFTQSSFLSSEEVLVNSMAGEAIFRKGYLKSWFFSYRNWRPNLLIKLRFKEAKSSDETQVILSNVCCDSSADEPSVFIYVNPATGKVTAGVKTAHSGTVSVDLTYNVGQYRSQWKEVVLQRAGGELKMKLSVTGSTFSQTTPAKEAFGEILISKCTLKLGGPMHAGKAVFQGKMSDFFLTDECEVIPSPELI